MQHLQELGMKLDYNTMLSWIVDEREKDKPLLCISSEAVDYVDFSHYCLPAYTLQDVVIRCLSLAALRGIDLTHVLDNMDDLSMSTFDGWAFPETAYDMCFPVVTANAEAAVLSTIEYVFHYCKAKGIDIVWFIEQKMKYNRLRPYMHGGLKY